MTYDPIAIGLVAGWALAAVVWWKWRRMRRSYQKSLEAFATLLVESTAAPKGPTPHQKAAETKKQKRLAEMRAHREAMLLDIARRMGC